MKLLFILIIFLLIISSVNAETLLLRYTGNETLGNMYVDNYGSGDETSYLYHMNNSYVQPNWEKRSYIKFNLTGLPSNSIIEHAYLTFTIKGFDTLADIVNVTVFNVTNQTWDEINHEWYDQPQYFNQLFSVNVTPSINGIVNLTVTSSVIDSYDKGINNISFMIGSPFGYYQIIYWGTNNAIGLNFKPTLQIDYRIPLIPSQIDFSKFNYIRQYGKILSNHNACIDNTTLGHNITYQITIDQNTSIINVWAYEPCEFGCDTTTNRCNDSSINQYLIVGLILLIIVVIIIIIIKVIT